MTGAEKTFHHHERSGTDSEAVLFFAFRTGTDKAAVDKAEKYLFRSGFLPADNTLVEYRLVSGCVDQFQHEPPKMLVGFFFRAFFQVIERFRQKEKGSSGWVIGHGDFLRGFHHTGSGSEYPHVRFDTGEILDEFHTPERMNLTVFTVVENAVNEGHRFESGAVTALGTAGSFGHYFYQPVLLGDKGYKLGGI